MADMNKPGWVEVELWSTAPEAVEATRNTFKMLPGGAAGDTFLEEDGHFFVKAGFPEFAAVKQGYVKRVTPTGSVDK